MKNINLQIVFWLTIIYLNINLVQSTLNFEWCCELGRRSATNSRLCVDYSSLNGYYPNTACKFAFTICCNHHNKNEECERGKTFAFQQDSCFDSSGSQYSDCDSFTVILLLRLFFYITLLKQDLKLGLLQLLSIGYTRQ
jgi:hypothetical protein